ncbi:uncharacterized protein VTP21DRAFT_4120 [Calcarisporiella thermophila]|uniref:uncharacterized protein n=1 Tax=Calcarisporiella thermophila TaxID=911321 RepID=UPI003744A6AC
MSDQSGQKQPQRRSMTTPAGYLPTLKALSESLPPVTDLIPRGLLQNRRRRDTSTSSYPPLTASSLPSTPNRSATPEPIVSFTPLYHQPTFSYAGPRRRQPPPPLLSNSLRYPSDTASGFYDADDCESFYSMTSDPTPLPVDSSLSDVYVSFPSPELLDFEDAWTRVDLEYPMMESSLPSPPTDGDDLPRQYLSTSPQSMKMMPPCPAKVEQPELQLETYEAMVINGVRLWYP